MDASFAADTTHSISLSQQVLFVGLFLCVFCVFVLLCFIFNFVFDILWMCLLFVCMRENGEAGVCV